MLLILRSKKVLLDNTREFNERISLHLKNAGVSFSFASFEDIELFIEKDNISLLINGQSLRNWKTIYPRKVGPHSNLAYILANLSKKNKILFIDHFHEKIKDSSNPSKIIQMFNFARNGIYVPKTYYSAIYSSKQIKNASRFLGFPIVIKQCNTSHGSGVRLAKNTLELSAHIMELIENENHGDVFLQEFIPNDFEYRILVLGDTIGAVEKKIRITKNEFRNNVFLGAKEKFLKISKIKKTILITALKASRVSDIQISGVDIIEQNGRLVVLEANSCPDVTFDEKISPELKNLAKYLEKCEKK